ncbi:hypothetical protein GJAV_G00025190 [Gymnothorax javanicus]|nr:hypothetical protein GJAV_G00025190 [Gymnothorax javanicus]
MKRLCDQEHLGLASEQELQALSTCALPGQGFPFTLKTEDSHFISISPETFKALEIFRASFCSLVCWLVAKLHTPSFHLHIVARCLLLF